MLAGGLATALIATADVARLYLPGCPIDLGRGVVYWIPIWAVIGPIASALTLALALALRFSAGQGRWIVRGSGVTAVLAGLCFLLWIVFIVAAVVFNVQASDLPCLTWIKD